MDDQGNEGDADASDAKRKDKQEEEVGKEIKYLMLIHVGACGRSCLTPVWS